ncbi:hypothetical protein R6Q57_027035 [Mikania cordata]
MQGVRQLEGSSIIVGGSVRSSRFGASGWRTKVSKRSKASSTDSPGTSDARVHINLNYLDEEEEEDDEIEDLTRPIGRDRAKTDRARARRGSSSQTNPDYNQGIEKLSQRIDDFNELKRKLQRLVELQHSIHQHRTPNRG